MGRSGNIQVWCVGVVGLRRFTLPTLAQPLFSFASCDVKDTQRRRARLQHVTLPLSRLRTIFPLRDPDTASLGFLGTSLIGHQLHFTSSIHARMFLAPRCIYTMRVCVSLSIPRGMQVGLDVIAILIAPRGWES
jgi:hypothetical protein